MEKKTFEKLYKTYYMRVYSYVVTLTGKQYIAEEITQETFYRAFTAKNTFRGESSAMTWLLFLFIRYTKIDVLVKAGICTSVIGVCSFIGDSLINTWLGNEKPLPVFRPFIWRIDTVDGNVKWLILISCSIAGIILIVSGIIKQAKKKKLKSKNS